MSAFCKLYDEAVAIANAKIKAYYKSIPGFDSIVTHAGHNPTNLPDIGNPVQVPITVSTTFQQLEPGTGKYDYSRGGHYGRDALEGCLAAIDGADIAFAFSSGLAAIGAILQLFSHGDHIVAFDDLYGGTGRYFRNFGTNNGFIFDFVDMRCPEKIKAALMPSTKLVFLETPSNPLMRLVDIAEISRTVHAYNKDNNTNILIVVDNTFMTPIFQRPLDMGADISLYSCTKYINGHADVVMGSLAVRKGLPEVVKKLRFIQYAAGAVPSAFDCYLCLRGLRTLGVRMREHMRTGLIVAAFLQQHPKVQTVLHPAFESHPQHELAVRQMKGFSGMASVYLNATAEQTSEFVKSRKLFYLAESLGGYESLIEIPSIMTHASVPPETRVKLGISDSMVRLSVGIEDAHDLVRDLYEGLEKL